MKGEDAFDDDHTRDAAVAAPGHDVESHAERPAPRAWSAVAAALDRLFPKRGRAPYTTAERVVVLVVIRAMSFDASANAFNCFLSYPTIARWSGMSLASVKRAVRKHADGPAPLVMRSKPGHTRGFRHACYRFTLVRCPEQFAVARDAARVRHREQIDHALRDLQPDRIALQRQRQDFGGTLTETEYAERLRALEKAARLKTPARVSVRFPRASS